MATKIRLARGGAKKKPYYRIVAADVRAPRDGDFLERLGSYNPMLPDGHPERVVLNKERLQHWLSTGAQPTDRVYKFLHQAGLVKEAPVYSEKKRAPKKEKAA